MISFKGTLVNMKLKFYDIYFLFSNIGSCCCNNFANFNVFHRMYSRLLHKYFKQSAIILASIND